MFKYVYIYIYNYMISYDYVIIHVSHLGIWVNWKKSRYRLNEGIFLFQQSNTYKDKYQMTSTDSSSGKVEDMLNKPP